MGDPVIFQIENIFYPVIAGIGIVVSAVPLVILSQGNCGLSKCITSYLIAMAVGDLLFVFLDVILSRIAFMYFPKSFLEITPICRLMTVLSLAANDISVWFTVAFTFDRCMAICSQKLKRKYCTSRIAVIILLMISILSCLRCLPWWFALKAHFIIDNIPWHCIPKSSFYSSAAWRAFDNIQPILTPCIPCFVVLLLNAFTVKHILQSSRTRKGLLGLKQRKEQQDAEMENRKKSITLLLGISGIFLLLWLPGVIFFFYRQITNVFIITQINNALITISTTRMFQTLNCCTNTCFYVVSQSRFRQELKKAVKYPFGVIFNFINS